MKTLTGNKIIIIIIIMIIMNSNDNMTMIMIMIMMHEVETVSAADLKYRWHTADAAFPFLSFPLRFLPFLLGFKASKLLSLSFVP